MAYLPRSVKQAASGTTIPSSFLDVGFPLKGGLVKMAKRCGQWMAMHVSDQQSAYPQLVILAALTWYLGRPDESDLRFLPADTSGKLRNDMTHLPHNRACVFSTTYLREHRQNLGDAKEREAQEKKERSEKKQQEREEKKSKGDAEKKEIEGGEEEKK